jgi:signal peptidase I
VGLPGETIRIERGDVYARQGNTGEFKILRKDDPNKQQVVQQVVYDDRHAPHALLKAGWPEAWLPEGAGPSWVRDSDRRVFEISAADLPQSVRYQHLVPSMLDWNAVDESRSPNPNPRPQLISDFCGYNSYTGGRSHGIDDDRFWVGDLTFTCTVNVAAVSGAKSVFTMELNEGVRRYRCHIDVVTGMATLTRNDDLAGDANAEEIEIARGQTSIKGPGKYELRFANVDDRLCLWVNPTSFRSGLVTFNAPTTYDPPANRRPQDADLRPVAFSAQGLKASVGDLLVERDIYYRAERVSNDAVRYSSMEFEVDESLRLREALVDPQEWGEIYDRHSRKAEFTPLEADEFFVMGDNSPRSQDSRLWPNEVRGAANRHAVNLTALIGKAFFIYWPHAIPFMNNGRGFTVWGHSLLPSERRDKEEQKKASAYAEYTFPFYPQWWRWKRIR